MRAGGLEPPRPRSTDFKSGASTDSATLAYVFIIAAGKLTEASGYKYALNRVSSSVGIYL